MKYTLILSNAYKLKRQLSNRVRYFLVMSVLLCVSFIIFYFDRITEFVHHDVSTFSYWIEEDKNVKLNLKDITPSFTINTEGCTIPLLEAFDESVKGYAYKPSDIDCPNVNRSLLDSNRTHIWVIKENKQFFNWTEESVNQSDFYCCYKSFYRPDSVDSVWRSNIDDRIRYSDGCMNFTDIIEAKHEFVKVSCRFKEKELYRQMFVFALKKTMMKIDGKKEIPQNKSAYNVLILGIDNVSRLNFHRTMPGTLAYLKKKGAVELLGYNKVGLNSYPNIIPLLTGLECYYELPKACYPHDHATFDFCPFVWNSFKKAGYYTALGEDSAHLGTFNYLADGFFRTPTDYYMHPFTYMAEREVATKGYLCVKEKYFFQLLLDYVAAIADTLKNKRLFGFFWEVTMTHDYVHYPIVMDNSYVEFFKKLEKSKYLDESIIFLVSDHGTRFGSIRNTKQGRLEENLPLVFILTPESFRTKYKEAFNNLKMNSNRLTTPFDIYESLSDLVDLENIKDRRIMIRSLENYSSKRGISLFLPVPVNRTCKQAEIHDRWCTCHITKYVNASDNVTMEAGLNLIKHLNSLLKNHTQCARLNLNKVINVTKLVVGKPGESDSSGWDEYLVVVRTDPGDNEFEGIMRRAQDSKKWKIVGTANRLNRLGLQDCMHHPVLRLYCHCL